MIPEPTMTSKHADLLNELDWMQGVVHFALYRSTLNKAERLIASQETELAQLRERVRELEAALAIKGERDWLAPQIIDKLLGKAKQ